MKPAPLIEKLLECDEPAIRWRVMVRVLGASPDSRELRQLEQEVRTSPRVQALVNSLETERHVYAKWQGAHWVLGALADLGYPRGDASLKPHAQRVLKCWLDDAYFSEFTASSKAGAYRRPGVPIIQARHRRCASQQGYALLFLTQLELVDDRSGASLAERLRHWQWPDGGWNCDKNPTARTSSVMETLLPMRGLAVYGRVAHDRSALDAARRAAEVLLDRHVYQRRSTGQPIHPDFMQLHYPVYWHYEVLAALKGLAELDLLGDPRCADALDLLEHKELPTGGWPAERRYYGGVGTETALHAEVVGWGGADRRRANEWVTTDALYVLRSAGRL